MRSIESTYDAIVVGSGAAGSWAAKELTEGGLKVVLLEAGRNLDIVRDFPAHAAAKSIGIVPRIKSAIRGQHVQARSVAFSDATRHFYVNDRENPYTTAPGSTFRWYRGRQLGGRLHTWYRHAPRMSNFEFKAASVRGDGIDWPLSYEDVMPYYDIVERTLGVYGVSAGIPNCPDGQFLGPAKTTKVEEAFLGKVERLLPRVRATYARKVRYDKERIALPVRLALATGRLDIRTDAVVSRLLIDAQSGKATGVEYIERLTGHLRAVYGKVVVLCASTIESVRILQNSACATYPSGVGGSSGHLGRYLCDHVVCTLVGKVPESEVELGLDEDGFDFGNVGLYIPSFCERESKNFPGGYGIQISIGRGRPRWAMTAFGEMQPRYENRVSLDPIVKDAWGIPVAKIECRYSRAETNMVAHMRQRLPEIAAVGGLRVDTVLNRILHSGLPYPPGVAIHETGGARMGDKPDNSVVNSYCQCWDADNVFVTDGACFVHSGFQNPTLTIMALTVRACRFIVHDYAKCVS